MEGVGWLGSPAMAFYLSAGVSSMRNAVPHTALPVPARIFTARLAVEGRMGFGGGAWHYQCGGLLAGFFLVGTLCGSCARINSSSKI